MILLSLETLVRGYIVMNELTELEICKRVAEIEGLDFYLVKSCDITYPSIKVWHDSVLKDKCVPKKYFEQRDYNPLTDDALCFQLSDKYNVSIMHYEEHSTARIWDDPEDNPIADISTINNDTNLNKAICLAIIEAHKDK